MNTEHGSSTTTNTNVDTTNAKRWEDHQSKAIAERASEAKRIRALDDDTLALLAGQVDKLIDIAEAFERGVVVASAALPVAERREVAREFSCAAAVARSVRAMLGRGPIAGSMHLNPLRSDGESGEQFTGSAA